MKDDIDQETLAGTSSEDASEKEEYSRFTAGQKRLYLAIVSVGCFLSPISTTMFLPAIPDIAKDFHTSRVMVTLSNTIYCVAMAISPCIASPLTSLYGRRYPTVVSSLGYTITAFIVSQARNLAMFYVFRLFMALFGTAFFTIGSTIISDIFIPEERGQAMGILLIGSQAGLALAAVIGGLVTSYLNWRIIFILQGCIGAVVFAVAVLLLKETGRGVLLLDYRKETGKKFKFYWFNPFSVLLGMRYDLVIMVSFISATCLYNQFALLTPINYVIKRNLDIDSTVLISLFYLAPGTGFVIGSVFGGRFSDYTVKYYKSKRGKRVPEDRLRSTFVFYSVLVPISILLYGWSLERNFGGIALPVAMMFINGLAQCCCFSAFNSYAIDMLPHMTRDVIACGYFLRFSFAAIATGTILPQISHIGIGWTCTLTSGIVALGTVLLVVIVLYGDALRKNHFEIYR